jgi:hypothetical protein
VRRLALLLSACLALLAACGKEQEPAPRVFDVKAPKGERTTEFPRAGMTVTRPRNWSVHRREAPGVFELVSGQALVAAWAYPRPEPLPKTDEQLEAAKDRLIEEIEKRDPDFHVRSAVTAEVAGSRAIDVRGDQVLSRRELSTRSVHIFEGEVEYVIEAIAPPADYTLVDTRVLEPLLESLVLEGGLREEEE